MRRVMKDNGQRKIISSTLIKIGKGYEMMVRVKNNLCRAFKNDFLSILLFSLVDCQSY